MTGLYLRVLRDGKWQNIEMDEMTNEELNALQEERLANMDNRGWAFAVALAKWIRENVKEK